MQTAKQLLKSGNYTCVLKKDDIVLTSEKRGVMPLIEFIDSGRDFTGFCAADKIVGKAAAYLYVILGVTDVYAFVMSNGASEVFKANDINFSADVFVDKIINRQGNGLCPMELAVSNSDSPLDALEAIRRKLDELKGNR